MQYAMTRTWMQTRKLSKYLNACQERCVLSVLRLLLGLPPTVSTHCWNSLNTVSFYIHISCHRCWLLRPIIALYSFWFREIWFAIDRFADSLKLPFILLLCGHYSRLVNTSTQIYFIKYQLLAKQLCKQNETRKERLAGEVRLMWPVSHLILQKETAAVYIINLLYIAEYSI